MFIIFDYRTSELYCPILQQLPCKSTTVFLKTHYSKQSKSVQSLRPSEEQYLKGQKQTQSKRRCFINLVCDFHFFFPLTINRKPLSRRHVQFTDSIVQLPQLIRLNMVMNQTISIN